ncbi:Druantia anti-phage system protein DruA [Stenotrophomonas sp. P5_B8]
MPWHPIGMRSSASLRMTCASESSSFGVSVNTLYIPLTRTRPVAWTFDAKSFDDSVDYAELRRNPLRHRTYFPSGAKIHPEKNQPVVVPVAAGPLAERLFRTMRGYWSMPYSKGYGRRLRFVVMDAHHDVVIVIIGLHSPSADLACWDDYLGVSKPQKLAKDRV